MTLVAGATIGPYRVVEQIGRGGMATVYKAHQPALARYVAIKVLPAFFAEDPGFRERFQQEAVAVAKLRHPNIVQVFDYGEEGGVTYIVSEYVDGGTLADQLGAPLPLEYVARTLGPIAAALDYAHARGVLHRDIKPSNVLLARDGTPILSDFGLAKMVGSLPRLTQTGTTVGTPEYMAPEQGAGEAVGPAADQYALAVVAYEMLTGRVPFSAETPLAVLLAHVHKPLPLPRAVNPALSTETESALLKGLAKAPGDRYPNASELVRALEAAKAAAPRHEAAAPTPPIASAAPAAGAVPSPPTPAATLAQPRFAAGRREALIAGGAVVLLLAAAAAYTAFVPPAEEEGPPASVDVEIDRPQVEVTRTGAAPIPVVVTVTYGNGRDAVLSDVLIVFRPMKDAVVVGGTAEDTPEGLAFRVGDLGPWAGGELKVQLYFTSLGSRVIQATIKANELEPITSDAETVSVVAAPP